MRRTKAASLSTLGGAVRRGEKLRITMARDETDLELPSVLVIPVVIGALGTVSEGLGKWLNLLGMPYNMEFLQRVCLQGTARIIRTVLDTEF